MLTYQTGRHREREHQHHRRTDRIGVDRTDPGGRPQVRRRRRSAGRRQQPPARRGARSGRRGTPHPRHRGPAGSLDGRRRGHDHAGRARRLPAGRRAGRRARPARRSQPARRRAGAGVRPVGGRIAPRVGHPRRRPAGRLGSDRCRAPVLCRRPLRPCRGVPVDHRGRPGAGGDDRGGRLDDVERRRADQGDRGGPHAGGVRLGRPAAVPGAGTRHRRRRLRARCGGVAAGRPRPAIGPRAEPDRCAAAVRLSWLGVGLGVVVALAIGAAGATRPARTAARLTVRDTLAHE